MSVPWLVSNGQLRHNSSLYTRTWPQLVLDILHQAASLDLDLGLLGADEVLKLTKLSILMS